MQVSVIFLLDEMAVGL